MNDETMREHHADLLRVIGDRADLARQVEAEHERAALWERRARAYGWIDGLPSEETRKRGELARDALARDGWRAIGDGLLILPADQHRPIIVENRGDRPLVVIGPGESGTLVPGTETAPSGGAASAAAIGWFARACWALLGAAAVAASWLVTTGRVLP